MIPKFCKFSIFIRNFLEIVHNHQYGNEFEENNQVDIFSQFVKTIFKICIPFCVIL